MVEGAGQGLEKFEPFRGDDLGLVRVGVDDLHELLRAGGGAVHGEAVLVLFLLGLGVDDFAGPCVDELGDGGFPSYLGAGQDLEVIERGAEVIGSGKSDDLAVSITRLMSLSGTSSAVLAL